MYNLNIDKSNIVPTNIIIGRVMDKPIDMFDFKIYNGVNPMDLTGCKVEFRAQTPKGGKIVEENVTITSAKNGEIKFTFPKNMYSSKGRFKNAYFVVIKGERMDSTNDIMIDVLRSVDFDAEDAEEVRSELENIIADAQKQMDDAVEKLTKDAQSKVNASVDEINALLLKTQNESDKILKETNEKVDGLISGSTEKLNKTIEYVDVTSKETIAKLNKDVEEMISQSTSKVNTHIEQSQSDLNAHLNTSIERIDRELQEKSEEIKLELSKYDAQIEQIKSNMESLQKECDEFQVKFDEKIAELQKILDDLETDIKGTNVQRPQITDVDGSELVILKDGSKSTISQLKDLAKPTGLYKAKLEKSNDSDVGEIIGLLNVINPTGESNAEYSFIGVSGNNGKQFLYYVKNGSVITEWTEVGSSIDLSSLVTKEDFDKFKESNEESHSLMRKEIQSNTSGVSQNKKSIEENKQKINLNTSGVNSLREQFSALDREVNSQGNSLGGLTSLIELLEGNLTNVERDVKIVGGKADANTSRINISNNRFTEYKSTNDKVTSELRQDVDKLKEGGGGSGGGQVSKITNDDGSALFIANDRFMKSYDFFAKNSGGVGVKSIMLRSLDDAPSTNLIGMKISPERSAQGVFIGIHILTGAMHVYIYEDDWGRWVRFDGK